MGYDIMRKILREYSKEFAEVLKVRFLELFCFFIIFHKKGLTYL